jgi:hypothetical protein
VTPAEVSERTQAVIRRCRALGAIPNGRIDDTESLARAGEWGIAIENLCEQLYDAEVNVPADIVEEIRELATAMRLKERYWRMLMPGWQPSGA